MSHNETSEDMLHHKLKERDVQIAALQAQLQNLRQTTASGLPMQGSVEDELADETEGLKILKISGNVFQYDPKILKLIDFTKSSAKYDPYISPISPGQNLLMRPLQLSDYDRGFLKLLTQLTKVGDISQEQFQERFMQMKNSPENYYVTVIENTETKQIVASATLVKETKFIHQASARGRVEDVVVSNEYRGKQLGKLLVDCMTLLSAKVGCYKVSLECKDHLVKFYSQFGFVKEHNQNYMFIKWWD